MNTLSRRFSFPSVCRPKSLGQELADWADRFGSRPALADGRRCLTYTELHRRVEAIARGLHARGIRPGMRAILQFPNSMEFVLACFACLRLGVIPVLTLPAWREADLDSFCDAVTPAVYFAPNRHAGYGYLPMMRAMQARHDSLVLLASDAEAPGVAALEEIEAEGAGAGRDGSADLPHPSPDSAALVIMTGGTTNLPKMVPKIHNQYMAAAAASALRLGMTKDSVYLVTLPIGHHFSMGCPGILGAFSLGAKAVIAQSPSFDTVFDLVERERVTHMPAVPPLLRAWADAREFDDTDLSSLELVQVGGGPLDAETLAEAEKRLGCGISQAYGFTEGCVCYSECGPEAARDEGQRQGLPLFEEDELRVVDSAGRDLPPGEEGELLFRGPCLLSGYFMQDAGTNAQWLTPDGWYRSGDIAAWTEDGRIRIVGRLKDIINRAGEKFSARENELRLLQHPAAAGCAVVGVPDRMLGERQCVFILPAGEERPGLAEIRAWLAERGAAPFKLPDQLEYVNEWPVTAVGKLDKRKLTLMAQEQGRQARGR